MKKELASHKRVFLGILILVRKNRVLLMSSFDNDALHDLRVALRRVQAIDSLCKGSIGICMNKEVQEWIKKVLKVSSNLRDIEELSSHTGFCSGALLEQKERLLTQFLESIGANVELEGAFVCKELQERLGKINDLRVWMDLLKREGVWMDGLKEQLMAHLLEAKAESGAFGSKEYLQMICKNMCDKMILSKS